MPVAALATFTVAFWVAHGLHSAAVCNAALVGVVATLLTLGFLAGAKPSDRPMYIVSFVARLLTGYLAGVIAARVG